MTPFGYPSDHYHCLLDEQPHYLVPPRLFRPEEQGELVVNPECWFSWSGRAPEFMMSTISAAQCFLPSPCMVWVREAMTGALWPYWVGAAYIHHMAGLAPGQAVTSSIPRAMRWVLRVADILVTPDHLTKRRSEWRHFLAPRVADYKYGYLVVANVIPPLHLGALRRYYRSAVRMGRLTLGDDQVARRYVAHNEPVARFIHRQLAPFVSDIVRARIKPSYSYVAAYQSGSILERHTDREQCEYSVALCVDATPEPEEQCSWPINLDTAKGTVRVWQYLGEGLLYRGRKLPHYRAKLPNGCTSTSLLFHYVDHRFSGPLD